MSTENHQHNVVIDFAAIIERLKASLGLKSDAELARELGAPPNKLSVWKLRNTIPYDEIIALCSEKNLDLEWVLVGHGKNTAFEDLKSTFHQQFVRLVKDEGYPSWAKRIGIDEKRAESFWRGAGGVPLPEELSLIALSFVSLDWLLTGRGEPYRLKEGDKVNRLQINKNQLFAFADVISGLHKAAGLADEIEIARELDVPPNEVISFRADHFPIKWLVSLAVSKNINIDWLLFQEEPQFFNAKRENQDQTTVLDPLLLQQIIEMVEEEIRKLDARISEKKKARLITMLYIDATKHSNQIRHDYLQELLDLLS